jgi:hypothetical protein
MNKKLLKFSKNSISILSFILFIVFALASGENKSSENNKENDSIQTSTENTEKERWSYSEDEDKMEGRKQFYATNTSTNEVEFEFPYDGGSTFDIIIRNLGKRNEVLLTVSKGQFMTSIGSSDNVKVKFDDEKPVNYSYNSAADASSDVIFINNSQSFIAKLKTAKKVMIECTFFDAGRKIMEFDVEGLKWDK